MKSKSVSQRRLVAKYPQRQFLLWRRLAHDWSARGKTYWWPILWCGFMVFGPPREIQAQTHSVTVCDQSTLLVALKNGGNVSFGCDGTIMLDQTLVINGDTTLDGSGHSVTLNGNNAVRLFSVGAGQHLRLINLTLANGSFEGAAGADAGGGAILNNGGTVELEGCRFTSNSVTGGNQLAFSDQPAGRGLGGGDSESGGNCNCLQLDFFRQPGPGGGVPFSLVTRPERAG